jgi:hypothetical protein
MGCFEAGTSVGRQATTTNIGNTRTDGGHSRKDGCQAGNHDKKGMNKLVSSIIKSMYVQSEIL